MRSFALSLLFLATASAAPVTQNQTQTSLKEHEILTRLATTLQEESLRQDSCNSFNRDAVNWDLVPKAAVEKGMESLLLQAMAYERKKPGKTKRSEWPNDAFPPDVMEGRLTDIVDSQEPNGEGAFGFTALLDGATPVLAFAGTSDSANAWDDVRSIKATSANLGGKHYLVGSGFYDEYAEVMKSLDSAVKTLIERHDGKLLIVGHSLGGAIANIAAVDMANKYQAKVVLRTAGAPRAFAWGPTDSAEQVQTELLRANTDLEKFGATFPSETGIVMQRLTNYNDIVPALLACTYGYMHVGAGAFYIRANRLNQAKVYGLQHQDFTPYHDPTWVAQLVEHHYLASYYKRMKDALTRAPQ